MRSIIFFLIVTIFLGSCMEERVGDRYLLDELICGESDSMWANSSNINIKDEYPCPGEEFLVDEECKVEGDECERECSRVCRGYKDTVMVCHERIWKAEETCGTYSKCDDYYSLSASCMQMDAKPNIYLYPTETTKVSVMLNIVGEGVVESIPEYNDGWFVEVTPDGIIDGKYSYLFFEAMASDQWQRERGWVLPQQDLESSFRGILYAYGFRENEIEDFINWWIPKLNEAQYYKVFPQKKDTIDRLEELKIFPKPDYVFRQRFVIEKATGEELLLEPQLPEKTIKRDGLFTVFEWGVIITNSQNLIDSQ